MSDFSVDLTAFVLADGRVLYSRICRIKVINIIVQSFSEHAVLYFNGRIVFE